MFINIAIVEDEQSSFERLSTFLECYKLENSLEISITRFETADAFLFDYQQKYQIIFMDIAMPGTNGMEAARKLRKIDQTTLLVFVTTISNMACKGYEVDAIDYIVKPVEYPSFKIKMNRIITKIPQVKKKTIEIKTEDGFSYVQSIDIKYIEVKDHTLLFHTTKGDYKSYGSLKNFAASLADYDFYLCNNCYLVNMSFITGIDGYNIFIGYDSILICHPKKIRFCQSVP